MRRAQIWVSPRTMKENEGHRPCERRPVMFVSVDAKGQGSGRAKDKTFGNEIEIQGFDGRTVATIKYDGDIEPGRVWIEVEDESLLVVDGRPL